MQLSSLASLSSASVRSLPPVPNHLDLPQKLSAAQSILSDWVMELPDAQILSARCRAQNTILQAIIQGHKVVHIDTHDLPPSLGNLIDVRGPQPAGVVCAAALPHGAASSTCTIQDVWQRTEALVAQYKASPATAARQALVQSCKALIVDLSKMDPVHRMDAFNSVAVTLAELCEEFRFVPGHMGLDILVARLFRDDLAPAVNEFQPRFGDDKNVKSTVRRLMATYIDPHKENLDASDRRLFAIQASAGMSATLTLS